MWPQNIHKLNTLIDNKCTDNHVDWDDSMTAVRSMCVAEETNQTWTNLQEAPKLKTVLIHFYLIWPLQIPIVGVTKFSQKEMIDYNSRDLD